MAATQAQFIKAVGYLPAEILWVRQIVQIPSVSNWSWRGT
jgi:hypothetical protein